MMFLLKRKVFCSRLYLIAICALAGILPLGSFFERGFSLEAKTKEPKRLNKHFELDGVGRTLNVPPSDIGMAAFVDYWGTILSTQYASKEWKEQTVGLNLESEIEKARAQLARNKNMTLREYHKVIKDLAESTQDYHVRASFCATEKAILPLTVRRGFDSEAVIITSIDRESLSEKNFPFSIGDEIVTFNNKPVLQEMKALQSPLNRSETERALADLRLTYRAANSGVDVPRGAVLLGIRPKGSAKIITRELYWLYTKENISLRAMKTFSPQKNRSLVSLEMGLEEYYTANPSVIGQREGFLPPLGEILWRSSKEDLFDAYIYTNGSGKKIAYVRIGNYWEYANNPSALPEFKALVARFEEETEALVIDQFNNPGGDVQYLCALLGCLTEDGIDVPKHRESLYPEIIDGMYTLLELFQSVKTEEDAYALFQGSINGMPVGLQDVIAMRQWCEHLIDEWSRGKTLSSAHPILGINRVPAITEKPYTKPIVVLINELDFSGGDFFPVTLQDNGRAVLFGTQTAGAGGYVRQTEPTNAYGVKALRFTASIAERTKDNQPFEGIGALADVFYQLTQDDLQNNYQKMRARINETVEKTIEEKTSG